MPAPPDVFDTIRAACAKVAAQADHVRIDDERLATYARDIGPLVLNVVENDPGRLPLDDVESTISFVVTLDAINFGSGYFPFLRKRPGMSGYHTIATALREHVERHGPLTVGQLCAMTAADCAAMFGQELDGTPVTDLMNLFAIALADLGELVAQRHDGSFTTLVAQSTRRASSLVRELDRMTFFHDVSTYRGMPVPLYKRAQIAVNDLASALDGDELGRFDDLDQLTMFPDNLVPHVLRLDEVLVFDPLLLAQIERGHDITSGSEPEVEIRAVSLHAVERLSATLRAEGIDAHPRDLDTFLWNRGGDAKYKAVPRHRTRCVYY